MRFVVAQASSRLFCALLVAVGGDLTFGLLHDEVIDRLRQPQRPLVLRVRDVPEARLEKRRSEARTYALAARARAPSLPSDQRPLDECGASELCAASCGVCAQSAEEVTPPEADEEVPCPPGPHSQVIAT